MSKLKFRRPYLTTNLVATIEATPCLYCGALLEAVEYRGLIFAKCPEGEGVIFYPLRADEGLVDALMRAQGEHLSTEKWEHSDE